MAEPVRTVTAPAGPPRHWTDWINVVAAVWLFISPWVVASYSASPAASWIAWATAVVVGVVALVSLRTPRAEWINVVAAVWLFVTPWIFGYGGHGLAWNAWIVAIIVFFAALGGATGPTQELAAHRHA